MVITNRVFRAHIRIEPGGSTTDIHVTLGGLVSVRLIYTVGITHKVRTVLRTAPELDAPAVRGSTAVAPQTRDEQR